MNSSSPIFEMPKRNSLSAQAAASITQAIENGTWKEFLPSERRLCEMLRISRPTIRTALRMLEKNGLIEIRQGRRNRLLKPRDSGSSPHSRLVGLLTHEPFTHMSAATYQNIGEMQTLLAKHGFTTEVIVCPTHSAKAQRRKLEEFVRHNRVFCCVLLSVSKELQKWFTEHSVPALVLGSCHADVRLPSLDIDYRSVCRHAGGLFLSKGHRRMALVVPNSGVAGDLASEVGFREAIPGSRQDDASATIVRHNGTAANITAKLDQLFKSPHAPTALLVAKTQHVFTVIIYLLKRGLAVPDTISLIARDHDHIFETVHPPISHYTMENDTFAHRLSRLMMQMVSQGYLPPEPDLFFPRFFQGGTVRQLR